jgi:hypothetical protein
MRSLGDDPTLCILTDLSCLCVMRVYRRAVFLGGEDSDDSLATIRRLWCAGVIELYCETTP